MCSQSSGVRCVQASSRIGRLRRSKFLDGSLEIASVPDRESVDDEAERRRSVELRLVAAITEAALAAEADLPCHGVQALLAVQSDQHSAPERLVVYVAQDVPGLGHPAELL